MRSITKWTGFILLLTLLGGCPRATINYVMINRDSGTSRWQINNPLLANEIRILDVKETNKNGLLYLNILIKNSWYRPISGKIKVEFYDRNGLQLENPWGWRPLLLESHQEEWFEFMAPKTESEITKTKIMLRGIGQYSMPER